MDHVLLFIIRFLEDLDVLKSKFSIVYLATERPGSVSIAHGWAAEVTCMAGCSVRGPPEHVPTGVEDVANQTQEKSEMAVDPSPKSGDSHAGGISPGPIVVD